MSKNTVISLLLGLLVGTLVLFGAVNGCGSEQYAVPGWEHGVVLCDADCIIINVGHETDPEAAQLLELAKKCENYDEIKERNEK